MHCLTCHYNLAHLTAHRCPECGQAFDPNDPATFESNSVSRLPYVISVIALVCIPAVDWFLFELQRAPYLSRYPAKLLKSDEIMHVRFVIGVSVLLWLGLAVYVVDCWMKKRAVRNS